MKTSLGRRDRLVCLAAVPSLLAAGLLTAALVQSPTTPKLQQFDAAYAALQADQTAVAKVTATKSSWPAGEVAGGHAWLAWRTARFAKAARALLLSAEIDSGAIAALEYEQHPDIPFAPLTVAETLGADYSPFGDPNDPRVGLAPILGYEGSQALAIPDSLSDRFAVWDNQKPAWGGDGDRGPLWGWRGYNVGGVIRNVTQYRVGNWTKGKEGHALYLNPLGPLLIENVHAFQCGAQWGQFAHRPKETKVHPSKWTNPMHAVTIRDCSAIDCGAINSGDAVRASWPLAFYATGHSVVVERFTVRTDLEPFSSNGMTGRRSHGAVFIGPGTNAPVAYDPSKPDAHAYAGDVIRWTGGGSSSQDSFQGYFRTPSATFVDLDVEVWDSDREEVRVWNVGSVLFIRPRIVEHGGQADLVIVDDCGEVRVVEPLEDLTVSIKSHLTPYGPTTSKHVVKAGETWTWNP